MVRSLRVWRTLAGISLVTAVSCREVAVTAVEVANVDVAPATATLAVGERFQFNARVEDATGRELLRDILWNSTASQIATVTSTGEVLALGPGTATISATSGGVRGEATVQVSGEAVARVEVQPLATSVQPGDSVRFQATAFATDGSTILGRIVTWSVETGTIAIVRQSGWAIGQANGTTRVFATVGGVRGEATLSVRAAASVGTISVTPPATTVAAGATTQLTATARTGDGSIITPQPAITWTTSAAAVATADANGLVTGQTPGTATITASAGGASGQSIVTVVPGAIASVEIQPSATSMVIGSAFQFQATARDAAGNVVTGLPTTWRSTNALVVDINANGVAIANALGNAMIIATIASLADTAAVLVVPEPVSTVAISPPGPTLLEGDSVLLQADLRSASGAALTNRVVVWTSDDTLKAKVVSTGVRAQTAWVFARQAGVATITATSEGRAAQASVTINQKPVASVQVQPAALTVIVGGTGTLATVLRAADGTILSGRVVTWMSSRPGVATVSSTGVVSGVTADTATVTATAGGVSGTAKVTVSPKPVATVQIQPLADTVFTGDSIRFDVVLRATDGTVLTQRQVAWSSSNASTGRVNPGSGANTWVSGVQPGSITLTAVSEGVAGTASVLVQLKPVATVTIIPPVDTVKVGTGAWVRAVLRAADGTVLTNRPISWSSGSTAVATVAPASGDSTFVTGVAVGNATITATAGGVSGQATMRVDQAPVASITIQPAVDTLTEGGTATLTAVVRDASGAQLTDRTLTWSSNSGVVSVSGNAPLGLTAGITANACTTGTSTCNAAITATAEGVNGSAIVFVQKPAATITIAPPAATLYEGTAATFQADVRAADGTALPDRRVTWSTNIAGRLAISPTGAFAQSANVTPAACPTGQTNCSAQLIAAVGSVSGAAAITILKPAATVTVSPATATVFEGDQTAYSAVARAADGTVIDDRQATWSYTGNGVASISTSGQFNLSASVQSGTCPQGQGSCNASITARIDNVPGSATLIVRKRVATVVVTPSSATISEGGATTLTAVPRAADNTALTDRAVTWSSSAAGVATVTGSGAFGQTGNVTGGTCPSGQPSCAAKITATAESVDGTADVTVLKPITTITVAPAANTLFEGGKATLTATATAADGTIINNRPLSWSSAAPAIASVAGNGSVQLTADVTALACPVGSGTCVTTITATQGGASGQATVTVVKQANAVAVTFAADTVFEGGATSATAVVTAADGTVLADRTVTWSVNNAFATATPTGPFGQTADIAASACPTGQEQCIATVTASVAGGGPQGGEDLNILKPVSHIAVSPTSAVLSLLLQPNAKSATFSAAAFAADGTQILNRTITWCLLNNGGNCGANVTTVTLNTMSGPSVVATANSLGTVTLRAELAGSGGPVRAVATIRVDP